MFAGNWYDVDLAVCHQRVMHVDRFGTPYYSLSCEDKGWDPASTEVNGAGVCMACDWQEDMRSARAEEETKGSQGSLRALTRKGLP